ncbi:MAG: GAF domain-containing protein, partial [Byssovorax cruenta]
MCRVLVLDDILSSAQYVKLVIEERSRNTADIATTSHDAADLVTRAFQEGKPYEVFLIDQQLADGETGIEVMKALRRISPDTETIIFTGYGDSTIGMSAYQAGAFRYLPKPFENEELLYLIDAVREWRRARQEHGWQKIFTEMMEAAMQQQRFHDAAEVVVNCSLKLGFKRAHVFWVPTAEQINKQNLFVGIACAGHNRIKNFRDRLFPILEWFDLEYPGEGNNAVFLRKFRRDATTEAFGYHFPILEAIILPIRQSKVLKGLLLLDYDQRKRTLGEHERSLLNLFARQVSAVLNQASLHGREQRLLRESAIIQSIGRQITTKAASVNLIDLLEEIRRQTGNLMDVSNFSVFLGDEDNAKITFHLLYVNGVRSQGVSRAINHGFEEYLLSSQREILLSHAELTEFIQEQQIDFRGPVPDSLLAVPLRVEDKTIGGIIVSQFSYQGNEYFERDKRILLSVADQVAGAIQISRLAEAEREDTRRMQILQKASTEMLRIAQDNVDHFWLTLLTVATSSFGLGFNRALLFVEEENFQRLVGRMAVGTDSTEEAMRDWERDVKRNYHFENFLADLRLPRRRHTPFEKLIQKVKFDLKDGDDSVSQVIRENKRITMQENEVASRLPAEIHQCFSLGNCAILPLRAGNRVQGIVIVDNKHNHEPLNERSLDRLQNLLDNAGLVYETYQEQQKSADLLDATYEILGGAKDLSLRETLSRICRNAQTFTGADWVIILPLLHRQSRRFDVDHVGFAGTLKNPLTEVISASANFGGISQHVLRRGTLVVRDIEDRKNIVNRQLNISDHHFIKSEGVMALIGAVVRSPEDKEPLGLLYLDYRKPKTFPGQEKRQALSFASLAGVAISNARRMDEPYQRKQLRSAKEIAEVVGAGYNLEKTMEEIIRILHTVFEKTRLCVLLYYSDTHALKFAPATLNYYKIQNPQYQKQNTFPLNEKSIACRVARKALETGGDIYENVADVAKDRDYLPLSNRVESELCVSLMNSKNELLGVLVLERDRVNGFDDAELDLVNTVAQQLSMAIERAQQREELEFRTTVAAQTA